MTENCNLKTKFNFSLDRCDSDSFSIWYTALKEAGEFHGQCAVQYSRSGWCSLCEINLPELEQYFFHSYGYHNLTGTELHGAVPFFEVLLDYVLRVYSDSMYQPAAHSVTACTVRTDLQTEVFSETNWENPRINSTSTTEKQSAQQLTRTKVDFYPHLLDCWNTDSNLSMIPQIQERQTNIRLWFKLSKLWNVF